MTQTSGEYAPTAAATILPRKVGHRLEAKYTLYVKDIPKTFDLQDEQLTIQITSSSRAPISAEAYRSTLDYDHLQF